MSAHNVFIRSGRVGELHPERTSNPDNIELVTIRYRYELGKMIAEAARSGWSGTRFWYDDKRGYRVGSFVFDSFRRAWFAAHMLPGTDVTQVMNSKLKPRNKKEELIDLVYSKAHYLP